MKKSVNDAYLAYNLIMRILAGQARGRVLHTPSGRSTRPTDARSRETLFNILGERVIDARILDIYAGTGSIGLEALSRGADFCVFIEQNAAAIQAIRANVHMCGWDNKVQPQAQVWHSNMKSALLKLDNQQDKFDIIFADPPFNDEHALEDIKQRMDTFHRLLHNVEEFSKNGEVVRRRGVLVVQHQHRAVLELSPLFELQKSRRTGESILEFFEPVPSHSNVDLAVTSK
jgi:16S rRNA (guanine966-N2)-methyltransferase